jgi:hypothetical protein
MFSFPAALTVAVSGPRNDVALLDADELAEPSADDDPPEDVDPDAAVPEPDGAVGTVGEPDASVVNVVWVTDGWLLSWAT